MILVFGEDASLRIARDLQEVRRECEGIDVLSGVYSFYDATGAPLKAVFDELVDQRKLFGIIHMVGPGVYHLEPDTSSAADPLWVALMETASLEPNDRFATLDDLKAHLRGLGAVVDRPES